MKKLIFVASAAALAFAGPAFAKPGHGHGAGQGQGAGQVHGKSINYAHAQPIIPDGRAGYGVGGCPPGLAKKAVPCVPPGQAKQMFNVGQRIPLGYKDLLGYNALPYNVRSYYGEQLDPRYRYIYDNSYIYRVDPQTMLVQQILSALIRP